MNRAVDAAPAPVGGGAPAEDVDALVRALGRTDLRPGPVVDGLFRRLVAAATATPLRAAAVDRGRLALVQAMCAQGESFLEAHWSARVAADPGALAGFPYRDNYRLLARGEHRAIGRALGRRPRRIVVVGSGPLPLTAVQLHRLDPRAEITCVDGDRPALDQGARVAAAVCADASRLRFVHADAAQVDYAAHDAVLLAAMVGRDGAAKRAVLAAVSGTLAPGAVLAARSVPPDGRQWLYPRLDPSFVPPGLQVVGEWHPPAGVVNSLLLLRRAG